MLSCVVVSKSNNVCWVLWTVDNVLISCISGIVDFVSTSNLGIVFLDFILLCILVFSKIIWPKVVVT